MKYILIYYFIYITLYNTYILIFLTTIAFEDFNQDLGINLKVR